MATNNNRGGNRARTGKSNNNPAGHNQYDRGWMDSAKERPFTAAAAVGGAVAAGVFLWSKRNQISDQIAVLSDQLSEWREGLGQPSDTFAEEAMTLKEIGKKAQRPGDPTIESETQAGAVAY